MFLEKIKTFLGGTTSSNKQHLRKRRLFYRGGNVNPLFSKCSETAAEFFFKLQKKKKISPVFTILRLRRWKRFNFGAYILYLRMISFIQNWQKYFLLLGCLVLGPCTKYFFCYNNLKLDSFGFMMP